MKDMKVTFSDTPYDFAGWTEEKCGRLLMGLCRTMKNQPEIINDDSFQDALDNALKLFALSHGNLNGICCNLIYTLLVRFNVAGYDFLEDLLYGTKSSSIMKQIMQLERDEEIMQLIEANDKLNRTRIAELLGRSDCSSKWISQISEDIEYVHYGEKTWDWFYNKHHNDRNTFTLQFDNSFIQEVYEYFHSDAYKTADDVVTGEISDDN